jgi:DMSO reductase anchor subunit
MIYASLKPIHQWNNPWVVPSYLSLGLMSGYLVLDLLIRWWEPRPWGVALLSSIAVLGAWCIKERYWLLIDTSSARSTIASATLLGNGKVRLLEPPHTEENYLLREMGFHIARKHRKRLRCIARVAAFVVPGLLSLLASVFGSVVAVIAAGLALISATLGILVERWLFFAEAKHTVMLYYNSDVV